MSLVADRGILLLVEFDGNPHDRLWYGRRGVNTGLWHEAVLLAGTTGWGDLGTDCFAISGVDFSRVNIELY
mgnify:CR=1 FL=1